MISVSDDVGLGYLVPEAARAPPTVAERFGTRSGRRKNLALPRGQGVGSPKATPPRGVGGSARRTTPARPSEPPSGGSLPGSTVA